MQRLAARAVEMCRVVARFAERLGEPGGGGHVYGAVSGRKAVLKDVDGGHVDVRPTPAASRCLASPHHLPPPWPRIHPAPPLPSRQPPLTHPGSKYTLPAVSPSSIYFVERRVLVCVLDRERGCVCVLVRERERGCVCVFDRERERMCLCIRLRVYEYQTHVLFVTEKEDVE